MDANDIDTLIGHAAALLGLRIDADMRPQVREHLEVAAQMAHAVMEFPLGDDAESAQVFTA